MEQKLILIISEAFKTFFLISIPVLVAIVVSSLAVSFLQGFLGIRDKALSFCVRLIAFISVSTVFFNSFYETLKRFFLLPFE